MLDAWVIVNVAGGPPPNGGTLPVPVQPVQAYRVSVGPVHGVVTEATMFAPLSNHPLVGVGDPYGDETVRKYWVL